MDNIYIISNDTLQGDPVDITVAKVATRNNGKIVCGAYDADGYSEWLIDEDDVDKGSGHFFSSKHKALIEVQGRIISKQIEAQQQERVMFNKWAVIECLILKER